MPDQVDIDAHGRVIPDGDGTRRTLAERAGRFTIVPTVPDLLLACRTPAAGGTPPRARCSVAGDLAAFPIADLIAFVHQARLSGLLTVRTPGAERDLAFKGGEVRGARSTVPGERIGEVALRLGYVDEAQLAEVTPAAPPLGKALVERGFLSRPDLWKCLHEQVAVVFQGVLLARQGVFAMVDDPDLDLGIPLSLSTQSLLMDGIRRIDEMALFRARVPGMHAYVRRRSSSAQVALEDRERALLELVDGRRRLEDLSKLVHLDEFETTRIVYHLAEAGLVEVATEPLAAPQPSAARAEAVASSVNGALRLIAYEVATAGALEAFLQGVRTFMADGDGAFAPLWRQLGPARDGSIDVRRLLLNLAALEPASPGTSASQHGPIRFLSDALRELVLFYLFQAGEVLPSDADERLHDEVKRRLEALGEAR